MSTRRQLRRGVLASSWFRVRRLGQYGRKFPWQRLYTQLESINEVFSAPQASQTTAAAAHRVVKILMSFYKKPGTAPVQSVRLTGDTGFLQHSGFLEIQFPAETLQIESDTPENLRNWCALLEHHVPLAAQVNALEEARARKEAAEREARAAKLREEQRKIAEQNARKNMLEKALKFAEVARQGENDGDFKASYANYMAGISLFLKVLPAYKADPKLKSDYAKLSKMLQTIMGAAEAVKAKAAETYDLTVSDTKAGGAAQTSALLRGLNVVNDLVKERHHVPDALRTKGRDEFSRAEGGLTTRDRVVLEIFETEKSYVENLQILMNTYLDPLRQSEGVTESQATFINNVGISGDKLHAGVSLRCIARKSMWHFAVMFAGMIALNGKLLGDLGIRVHNWTSKQTIGDVFRRYAPFFKLYISFANAFDKLAKLLREVLDSDLNPHAKQARKILRPKSTACPSVDNLLIQPIQRIPRYVLLLKELLKCTQGPPDSNTGIGDVSVYCFGMKPMYLCVHSCAILVEQEPAHPDYELCIDALKKIESVAKAVDSGMQLFNNQQKMIEIQSSLAPALELVDRNRTFVCEADFPYFVCDDSMGDKISKSRKGTTYRNHDNCIAHCILFSDSALVIAFEVPKDRYEAALAATEAAASVDPGRHLNWAAEAVMGPDATKVASSTRPAKYEDASQMSIKGGGPLNLTEFLALAAQYCAQPRLQRIIAHCHPDLPRTVTENCSTHIVVAGCTELSKAHPNPRKTTASPPKNPRNGSASARAQIPLLGLAALDAHDGTSKPGPNGPSTGSDSSSDDDGEPPPAPPPRIRRADPQSKHERPPTPQGEGVDNSLSAEHHGAVPNFYGNGVATSNKYKPGRQRIALRCTQDFEGSQPDHISCRKGEGLWGFLLSANSWSEAPPSSDDETDDDEPLTPPSSLHVRQIATNTDLKKVTELGTRDGGWWYGQNASGRVGKFPVACVEKVSVSYKTREFAVELPHCGPARAVFPFTMTFYESPHPVVCFAKSEEERDSWLAKVKHCQAARRQSLAGLYQRGAYLDPSELHSIGVGKTPS